MGRVESTRATFSGARTQRKESERGRSASRAFDIIAYFRETGRPLRTTEVARALGLPNSSADDILKMLCAKGYITLDPKDHKYTPSFLFFRMAEDLVERFPVLSRIRRVQETIRRATGHTVLVSIQEGVHLRYVSVVRGQWFDSTSPSEGAMNVLVRLNARGEWRPTSCFAAAILASSTDREIIDIIAQLDATSASTNLLPLLEQMRAVRNQGFADRAFTCDPKIRQFAAWLPRHKNQTGVAIGCLGVSEADSRPGSPYVNRFREWMWDKEVAC